MDMGILHMLFWLGVGAGGGMLIILAIVKNKSYQAFVARHSQPKPLPRYPFHCPFCGKVGGDMAPGTYKCSGCQRTVVFRVTPTEEEAATMLREEADIQKIFMPSFNLSLIQEMVYNAFLSRPEKGFICFRNNYAEMNDPFGKNTTIIEYPTLDTKPGMQALTHQCMLYVKEHLPAGSGIALNEGDEFFSDY